MQQLNYSEKPWHVVPTQNDELGVRNTGGFICFLPKPSHYDGQDERFKKEMEEYEANADAISAIPEMEHALRSFIAGMDNTKKEAFPGHHAAYLETVVLPRAIEALQKAKIIL